MLSQRIDPGRSDRGRPPQVAHALRSEEKTRASRVAHRSRRAQGGALEARSAAVDSATGLADTMRPASARSACMVANPYLGIEEWFEPDKELFVVRSAEEAIERYRHLLNNESERLARRASRSATGPETAYLSASRRRIDRHHQASTFERLRYPASPATIEYLFVTEAALWQ